MSEHKNNYTAKLAAMRPSPPMFNMRPAFQMQMMLKPGRAIVWEAAMYREVEGGGREIKDEKTGEWVPLTEKMVWVVEKQGDVPHDWWCWGVFVCVEMIDNVAIGGKTRGIQSRTPNLVAMLEIGQIADMERQLKFGGQSGLVLQQ